MQHLGIHRDSTDILNKEKNVLSYKARSIFLLSEYNSLSNKPFIYLRNWISITNTMEIRFASSNQVYFFLFSDLIAHASKIDSWWLTSDLHQGSHIMVNDG